MAIEKIRPRVVDATGNYTFNDVTLTGNISSPTANIGNLTGVNNLTANSTTITVTGNLSTTANITAGNIKTDNLLYANGVAYSIGSGATIAGTNTQIQFNDSGSFGANSSLTFDKTTGTLTTTKISANGALLTSLTGANVTGTVGNATYATSAGTATSAATAGTVTTASQPNITSLGTLTSLGVTGNISSGNANLGNFTASNYFSGNGSLLTSITGANVIGNVGNALNAYAVAGANVSGAVTYAGTANAVAGSNVMGQVGNALLAGTVYTNAQPNITSVGTLTSLSVTGNITSGNATLGNLATANFFTGNGSLLTSLTGGNVTGNVGNALNAYAVAGANVSGTVSSATTAGTVTTAAQPNITSVGTLSSLGVTGNITSGNANLGNLAIANYFSGSGNLLSNIQVANVTGLGNLATVNKDGNSSNILYGNGVFASAPVTYGNSNVVTLLSSYGSNTIVTTGNITGGNIIGIIAAGSNTISTTGNANVGNLGFGSGVITGTGNITAGNANLGNATTSNYFIGNLYGTANLATYATTANAVAGANVSGAVTYATTANAVAGANVSGAVSFATTANAVAGANVSGAVSYATTANSVAGANVSGTVSSATTAGTVTTAAQPNITSVGTLSSVSVTGDISGANLVLSGNLTVLGTTTTVNSTTTRVVDPIIEQGGGANGAALVTNDSKDRGQLLHYYSGSSAVDAFMGWDNSNAEFAFASNVTVASEVVTFNNFGNVRASYFLGNGSQLTSVTATTASTVTTNAQPNITSVGTLTSLGVTGNITSGNANLGNAAVANFFVGNGSTLTALTFGNITTLTTAGLTTDELYLQGTTRLNVTASGSSGYLFDQYGVTVNPAIYVTSGQTLAFNLDVSGHPFLIQTSGGANYSVGLVHVNTTGTVSSTSSAQGQIAGTLYWKIPYGITGNYKYQCSIHGGMNGNIVVTDANIANVQVGNASVSGTVTTAAQPNITSVGTLTSLTTTGNISAGSNYFLGNGFYLSGVDAAGRVVNGTSNLNIATSGGNITMGVAGNAGIVTVTGTGANISGYMAVTGNVSAGNVLTNNLLYANGVAWSFGSGTPGGSNTYVQFNDSSSFAGNAGFTFNKTTTTLTANNIVASSTANLGAVGNVTITGGTNGQVLSTNGSGSLSWVTQSGGGGGTVGITVDNFTGTGSQTAFTLTTTPTSINQVSINYNGALLLRSSYSVSGATITFGSAPASGSLIEVTTTTGVGSGAGFFATRTYSGTGSQTAFTVTSGTTVSSVLVTLSGVLQTPTTDYTISGTTLTFTSAPPNGVSIQIRELSVVVATSYSTRAVAMTMGIIFGG